MKKSNKKGFTLIELMVVAIIVAILAAVAIPLMSGNKRRAVATEGQAGCSTIRTAIRVYYAEKEAWPSVAVTELPGIVAGDLNGAYFRDTSYSYTAAGGNVVITADNAGVDPAPPAVGKVVLTVDGATQASTWSGDLID